MAMIRAFRAVRPAAEKAAAVAALPYDVMNEAEARAMVEGLPHSFLHVDRAEVDLPPGTDPYNDAVYAKAADTFAAQCRDGVFVQDETPCLYLYRLTRQGHSQTGVVGCTAVDDYLENRIKKHELTRAEKEADRIRHVDALNANTGPIFLAHNYSGEVAALVSGWCAGHVPVYDFIADDAVGHTVWVVDDADTVKQLSAALAAAGDFYIADGHHRAASAVQVALQRRAQTPGYTGQEEFNFFLSVVFPADALQILDYNRVVQGPAPAPEELLAALDADFAVEEWGSEPCRPGLPHEFGMMTGGRWYLLRTRTGRWDPQDPVQRLDVTILQNRVLAPIFGIEDPRTDTRIAFVGGVRGLDALQRQADETGGTAFVLHPVAMRDLMAIADGGAVMPPKSTWFEPKLRSGLFVHLLG